MNMRVVLQDVDRFSYLILTPTQDKMSNSYTTYPATKPHKAQLFNVTAWFDLGVGSSRVEFFITYKTGLWV